MNNKRRAIVGAVLAGSTARFLQGLGHASTVPTRNSRTLRVICLEYHLTEMVLDLNIVPTGCADLDGYRRWVNYRSDALDRTVSVGSRQQPSLEAMMALKPDLILGVSFRHQPFLKAYSRIAPTLLFSDAEQKDGLDSLQQTWKALAAAVDRSVLADQAWTHFKDDISRLADTITMATHKRTSTSSVSTEMAFLQGVAGTSTFWGFVQNSIPGSLLSALGWSPATFLPAYATQGIVNLTLSDILKTKSSLCLLTDPRRNPLKEPIWQHVAAIRENRYRLLPMTLWPFGGLSSTYSMAQQIANAWRPVSLL